MLQWAQPLIQRRLIPCAEVVLNQIDICSGYGTCCGSPLRRLRGRLLAPELRRGLGAALVQEVAAPDRLVVLVYGRGGAAQHG
jgi:hypothetical protein